MPWTQSTSTFGEIPEPCRNSCGPTTQTRLLTYLSACIKAVTPDRAFVSPFLSSKHFQGFDKPPFLWVAKAFVDVIPCAHRTWA